MFYVKKFFLCDRIFCHDYPQAMRQSELWSRYRFICSCTRCSASPLTYVDQVLEVGIHENLLFTFRNRWVQADIQKNYDCNMVTNFSIIVVVCIHLLPICIIPSDLMDPYSPDNFSHAYFSSK